MITIEAPNYRIRYSDDEIPTDRAKFLLWCRNTLWDNVKNARLYKSYSGEKQTTETEKKRLSELRELRETMDKIGKRHNVVTCGKSQGECTECETYYKAQKEFVSITEEL